MKKLMTVVLLAVVGLLASTPRSQAWSKFNYGIGANWGWEGGGNSILFGLLRGEQMPSGNYNGSAVDGSMYPSQHGYAQNTAPAAQPAVAAKPASLATVKPASYASPQQPAAYYYPPQPGAHYRTEQSPYDYPEYWDE